ncbi:MAG: hypothetical protein ACTXOO_04320 [Sodalis sp. (in: enterobacteria)]
MFNQVVSLRFVQLGRARLLNSDALELTDWGGSFVGKHNRDVQALNAHGWQGRALPNRTIVRRAYIKFP